MIFKEVTGSELARKIGVHRTVLNRVIAGTRRTPRLRRFLSEEIGFPMSLWDEMDRELKKRKQGTLKR